ncbi:aspartyl/glutamyl-tRNA(Asn/Gln) amidotransferase, A subunit [Polytolypa hystricis UAMH7299]|uniref:Glutamyl-tRNA(Gln) amidotransferase subunit A, mitochondrial n=1 Tax=Polytolypa hystricis (strain UAMH7299) TaxID=1447883 RepID=A0A2B7YP94_POLH7|nr:aspartyl/glutamyl-tRNA(Asn/Gln) amidotransferase, A subunit [Polytolypa hystricis UAMH7299]
MFLLREAERCLANQKTYASLNAFITPLKQAGPWLDRVRDAEARRGTPKSAVDGKLVAVKDNICTRDMPTTCASRILDTFTSPYNASVVEYLEEAGAIVAGKTNLDEFGMGSHSTNSHFGAVRNTSGPGGDAISPGGSSGGSAVAVSTGQCHAALGTDTGGSVRLPAAYTGTVGFKPSYGLVSRWGVVAYANSLDTVGVIGSKISKIRHVFKIINRPDARDPTTLSPHTRARIASKVSHSRSQTPLRIGIPLEYNIHELTPCVQAAWSSSLLYLQSLGHTIHTVSLPRTKQALSAYYILAPAEASSNLAKYDGVRYGTRDTNAADNNAGGYLYASTRGTGFGDEVQRRILLGAFTLSAHAIDNYFIQAQRVRRLVQADFDSVFRLENPLLPPQQPSSKKEQTQVSKKDSGVDVLLCPTAPGPPPTLESLEAASSVEMYMNDVFTVPASLAGLPALSVPVPVGTEGGEEGTVGMQVIGQFGDDELVLGVGEMIEGMRG